MGSERSCELPRAIKVLIAGGFGVGKTTFVGSSSEIRPLRTEQDLTVESAPTDDLTGIAGKRRTTVALDLGRLTLDDSHVMFLFGTPGQERFWFMWDELCRGVLGAVVLADTRELLKSFAAMDFFELRKIPFIVAVNEFDGAYRHDPDDVRDALNLRASVPLLRCDARRQDDTITVLLALFEYLLTRDQDTPTQPARPMRPHRRDRVDESTSSKGAP